MNLEKEIFEISLNDIIPNRFQPREIFKDEELQELSNSIKEHGVIQPIIVRKIGDKYEIIAGERRYRASKLAGKETIPALVRNIDDKEAAKIALLENLQRSNLTPIEEAKTYQTILKIDNITQDELAANLGKSQPTIANKLRLLTLSEEVQTALLNSQISERHARSLLSLAPAQQDDMLHRIINEKLTVRQLDEEVMKLTGKAPVEQSDIEEGGPSEMNQTPAPSEEVKPVTDNNPAPAVNDIPKEEPTAVTQEVTPETAPEKPVEQPQTPVAPVSEAPVVPETPAVEPQPVPEAPIQEVAPVSETPVAQETPAVEPQPVADAPTPEVTPVSEAPVVPETPAVEPQPVPEAPIQEVAPVSEEPVVPETPVVEPQPELTTPEPTPITEPISVTAEAPVSEPAPEQTPVDLAPISETPSVPETEPKPVTPVAEPQLEIAPATEMPEVQVDIAPAETEPMQQAAPSNIFDKLRVQSTEPVDKEPMVLPTPDVSSVINASDPEATIQTGDVNDMYDLRFAINNFRQAIQNTEKFGFKVTANEYDNGDKYQIVIDIDKK